MSFLFFCHSLFMFIISFSMFFDVSRFCTWACYSNLLFATTCSGWRRLFPQFASSKFVLATESYGGHYVPAWRKPFWNSTERDLAASEDEEWWRFSKTNGYSCGFLADRVSNLRTPSEEILVAGVVLSNTCIDQRLQGHLFSLPGTFSFDLPLAWEIKASDQGIRFEVACVDQAVPALFSPHTHIRKQ